MSNFDIASAAYACEQEPLRSPFGFKGSSLTNLWQTVAGLTDSAGNFGLGLGVQSVLWSDPGVFANVPEDESNRMMLAITRHALAAFKGTVCLEPMEQLRQILPAAMEKGKEDYRNDRPQPHLCPKRPGAGGYGCMEPARQATGPEYL